MVDVKTAVSIGMRYLGEMIPISQVRDLQLEEASLSDDERFWLITFSYLKKTDGVADEGSQVESLFPFNLVRDKRYYKTVKLRRDDGEFFAVTNLVA